jgi:hypothetical protein
MLVDAEYKRILSANRKYQRELEKGLEKIVLDVLNHEGLVLNEEECNASSIAEYLLIAGEDYSIYQWIEDTRMNYPECFKED